jgi:hypothetical protein
VGYATLIEGEGAHGVMAIHPRGEAGAGDPVAARCPGLPRDQVAELFCGRRP